MCQSISSCHHNTARPPEYRRLLHPALNHTVSVLHSRFYVRYLTYVACLAFPDLMVMDVGVVPTPATVWARWPIGTLPKTSYYSFNSFRRQDNRGVNPYLTKNSHLIVVVRNIAEEVPRLWYFGEDICLIPVQGKVNISRKQERDSNQWEPSKKK